MSKERRESRERYRKVLDKIFEVFEMVNKINIRFAKQEDAQDIINHINQVVGESSNHTMIEGEFGIDVKSQSDYIEKVNLSNNSLMLISEISGKMVGLLTLIGGSKSKNAHCAELGITIKMDYCDRGLGHLMMNEMDSLIMKKRTIRKVNLLVHENNELAIKFYEEIGFVIEGRNKSYFFEDGEYFDGINMGKTYL